MADHVLYNTGTDPSELTAGLDRETLTVSQLNGLIQGVVQSGFPGCVWVCGEIQGYDRNRGKRHVFFDLCEKDSVSKDIVARIGLVLFARRKDEVEEILRNAQNAFELKDDIEVRFLCRVDFYPPHGALRLIVEGIDPVYTLGKIAQEKQRLIALLKKNGTLDRNKALQISDVPLKIGLITAYDSAAYNDFLSELNASGLNFRIFFKNSLMQGKGAEAAVVAAIRACEKVKGLDAIVVTRGGGSIADLSCFDSKTIAEAIAASTVPVLSGIGHEINITVTDLAAHTYQKTPTAIARFLVGRVEEFLTALDERINRILMLAQDRLADSKEDLVRTEESLVRTARQGLKDQHIKMDHYERLVQMVHPNNTLRRGFSITRGPQGRLIRSVAGLKIKTRVTTELRDGILESVIQKKETRDG